MRGNGSVEAIGERQRRRQRITTGASVSSSVVVAVVVVRNVKRKGTVYNMLAILNRMLAGDADVPVMSPDSAQDLWRLAQANRVTPALARCIQSDPESAWPDELRTKACEATAFSRFRNILLMALLNRIAKAFNEAGIDWIALKGPVFTAQYYGDLSARVSGDLDVLVLPAAV
ncbi:MAG TPA: hypothetical protein DCS43_11885, partial [Verrucomicrobia bacterium]|nr:hypothetical protein [Verrucomicrobiota bacterium]